jgi:hypothetical protein
MSAAPPPVALHSSLLTRVKQLLMQPRTEWQAIDAEPATIGSIYMGYVLPLAAIPAICMAIGWSVMGTPFFGTSLGAGWAIRAAISGYIATLIKVYVVSLVIDGLAPSFGGQKNSIQALKVSAYSMTAVWVVGLFYLVPALWVLSILGLYSLYLLYVGLPILMKSPSDKAMGYTIVTIVATIVVFVIFRAIVSRLTGGYGYGYL